MACVAVGGYFLGVKKNQNKETQKTLENINTVTESDKKTNAVSTDEVSKIYNSRYIFFVNEEEKADWRTYTNEDLGISFMVPKYCGEPEINKYYKHLDQAKILQGTFSTDCPIKTFSAKMPGINTNNDDPSFGRYEVKIKNDEFNTTTMKGVKTFVEHGGLFVEMSGFQMNDVFMTFNLKSSKYPVVTFSGNLDDPFRKVMNSVEIK